MPITVNPLLVQLEPHREGGRFNPLYDVSIGPLFNAVNVNSLDDVTRILLGYQGVDSQAKEVDLDKSVELAVQQGYVNSIRAILREYPDRVDKDISIFPFMTHKCNLVRSKHIRSFDCTYKTLYLHGTARAPPLLVGVLNRQLNAVRVLLEFNPIQIECIDQKGIPFTILDCLRGIYNEMEKESLPRAEIQELFTFFFMKGNQYVRGHLVDPECL